MKDFKIGTNLAVFILFFGIALIEAFQKQNWLEAFLFVLLGIVFIWAGSRKTYDLRSVWIHRYLSVSFYMFPLLIRQELT